MKKYKSKKITTTVFIALTLAIIVCACKFNFHVWRLQHPDAPTWTYFFQKK